MSTIRMTHFQRHKHPEGTQIINDLLIKNDHSNFFHIRNLPYDSFTPHHNFKKLFKANKKILKLLGKLDSKTVRNKPQKPRKSAQVRVTLTKIFTLPKIFVT